MNRRGLLVQAFLGITGVTLAAVAVTGAVTRAVTSRAFAGYLQSLPRMRGMGMGRQVILGGAERAFLAGVDRGIAIAALLAVALAAVAALALAGYLTRPLRRLTTGARTMASGRFDVRVDPEGPAEIAVLGEAFNDMAASLERAEELRRRMVSDVAHELRNPLAALHAQAEGVAEGLLAADPVRMRSILDDVEELTRLVDDLQQLALAEAGRLEYAMQPVDLRAIARREVQRVRTFGADGVSVEVDDGDRMLVHADEVRIAQALRNLLMNALRHTRTGEVRVRLEASEKCVTLVVNDTGEGIPEADLPFVFERFYRSDASRDRHTGGAGLGLAIVKRTVEDHGGRVLAGNRADGGAEVGFSLPAAQG